MAHDIDEAFTRQYEAEVHEDYQRKGSKLRNTVRQKSGIVGESTTFQKIGQGTAGKKTRHGKVPVMNVDHTPVICPLADWYAGDWNDKLDNYKTNIDERTALVNAGVYALGRKTDAIIVEDALSSATYQIAAGIQADRTSGADTGMNLGKVLDTIEALGNRDIPMEDGQLYGVVGWRQWTQLMGIEEFKNADYVGADDLPYKGKGTFAKWWSGAMWFAFSGLPIASTIRSCFVYHSSAIGHASGADVTTDITWHGDYASHFICNMMSQGAVMIDAKGVQEILCKE